MIAARHEAFRGGHIVLGLWSDWMTAWIIAGVMSGSGQFGGMFTRAGLP